MILTLVQPLVIFGYALCGPFVPTEILIKFNLWKLRKVFLN
jgi:hypothetical protein